MTEELTMEKFHVKGLDCAACAAKIEQGLNRLDGVETAVLDFARLTLHVKTNSAAQVQDAVRRIDPQVQLLQKSDVMPQEDFSEPAASIQSKKELAWLILASLLFVFQLLAEGWFHRNSLEGLEVMLVATAYLLAGWNVLGGAVRTVRRRNYFDENVLMVIATVGAMAIHAYSEAIGVMIFYKVGELLQDRAVTGSRRSIAGLLAARPDKAFVQSGNGYQQVAPESVNIGERLLVKPGEKVPLDGDVISGSSHLDTSVLTGESIPVLVKPGDAVLAGQINQTEALIIKVSRLFEESSIAKVMELVENATARKAQTEKFITVFARYYTPAVVLIAVVIAFVPPLIIPEASFKTWIYRALVLLVISCPCALVISIPLGYFAGIGMASRKGILVKGSNYIDALADVDTVVFDKTGTLTRGVFKVVDIVSHNGYSNNQILTYAAAAEMQSNHPIAASILEAFSKTGLELDTREITQHTNLAGQGVKAHYGGRDIFVGNDHLLHMKAIDHDQCDFDTTVVHVVVANQYAGYITIGDEIRADAGLAVETLRKQGVGQIAMLTGDNKCAAMAVSKKLKIDIVHADLLPEDKVRIFESIKDQHRKGGKIAFVGDGINDAPVIARADVGIAMGAFGSDAAIETADVVLMQDSPLKVAEAVEIAQKTRRIVWQNIGFVFLIKGIFIVLGSVGMASMWEAVFADMGTALLAVVNSTRILRNGFKTVPRAHSLR
ncbi:MAG: heavy metal translocating P-type ATPase [Desulfobacterales bacterium]|nr:heavy metal translocating P-type ATPase [Desulfobacterales bacterium]MDX2512623.1 heavy metal translocating P-type ATPase [Desulfobacterales bacterium]